MFQFRRALIKPSGCLPTLDARLVVLPELCMVKVGDGALLVGARPLAAEGGRRLVVEPDGVPA